MSERALFVVSRIPSVLLALVLGAVAGAVLTVAHAATVQVAGVSVPWGLLAGILIATGLLLGLRLAFESRVLAAAAAVGLIAASALLALQSAGGSLLVTASPVGYIWTFAPVVISALVLGWPERRPSRGAQAPKDRIESVHASKGPDQ